VTEPERPTLRVVRGGTPDAAELAALVAVLTRPTTPARATQRLPVVGLPLPVWTASLRPASRWAPLRSHR
jgi:hypothetical protein